ncbi:MAG: alginate export family protein [Deltaproteobacteria bacterium]
MSKRLIAILAVAFLAAFVTGAYAEVQNVKVSGDLQFMSVYRSQFDFVGKAEFPSEASGMSRGDNIFLSIARVRVDADLTDNVSATVRLIGEWLWGTNDNNNEIVDFGDGSEQLKFQADANPGVDIDLAYVTVKEFLCSPLTLVIGRQELHYGNDMIIGDSDTNRVDGRGNIPGDLSPRNAFDAIRAILNYDPLVVDLVYAKISTHPWWSWLDRPTNTNVNMERIGDRFRDDTDLLGVNANWKLGEVDIGKVKLMNTVVEAYYWFRNIGPFAFGTGADYQEPFSDNGNQKNDQLHTIGARISMSPIEDLTFQLEGALQRGRANITETDQSSGERVNKRQAWAMETGVGYNFKNAKYVPTLTALFAYFSGQDTEDYGVLHGKTFKGWDPMFENQKYGEIVNAIMPQTNVRLFGIVGTMKPMADMMVKAQYYRYWFNQPYDDVGGYYALEERDFLSLNEKRYAGQELDVSATYDYTEDVQIGLLAGWFFPSTAFEESNRKIATEVIGSMKVTF